MIAKCFFDTNIVVILHDRRDPRRAALLALMNAFAANRVEVVVSTQVLVEFYNVATRKLALPPEKAQLLVRDVATATVVLTNVTMVEQAMQLAQTSQLSIWDALIITAAAHAKCDAVLTEDLNDGQIIAGVRVVNPFNPANAALLPST